MAFDAGEIKGKIVIDKRQWDKSAKDIKMSQQRITAQTKKTGAAFKGMWKQVAAGIGVTSLITMGIRGLMRQVGDVVKKGREFEKEWANVTTMLSISTEETLKMKNELMNLSPTLGNTTELAKGMYQVLSASIEPAKAIEFLGKAAITAKAGITDTRTAVDALTTVINSYGMEAEDVTKVSDIMFQTVKRGKTTYEELATSLGTVVPIAATVGVNFKEISAAIATMTRMGINSGKATMQLRQVLMSILTPSEEATKLAEELGIKFGATALKTKGLAGWLKELREKTGGSVDAMKVFIPNARALTAVMALAGIRAEEYTEDLEGMEKVLGNTDEAFRKQTKSIDFWIVAIEEAGNKAKLAFFEGLIDPIKAGISTSRELDAQTRDLMGVSGDLGKVIGTLGKNQIDELTTKWKHNRMAAKSVMFVYLSLANIINQGQIPTLKSAAETWGEYSKKLKENKERIDALKDPYFGWAGMIAQSTDLLREKVRWILEDSKSSKESIERLEEYKKSLQEASGESYTYRERLELMARATKVFSGRLEELTEFKGVFDALTPPSELMARWEEFYNLVETPELDLIWEQQMGNIEEDTQNFIGNLISSLGGWSPVIGQITEDTEDMGEKTKKSFTDIAAAVGSTLHMIGTKNKAVGIATAIINTYVGVSKALSAYPPPVSFAMAALQLAAGLAQVKEIRAQDIPSGEKGAYLPRPAIIEAGHGAMGEVVLPLDRAPAEFFKDTGGGAKVDFNFYAPIISTVGLSDRDMDEAAEYLLEKVKDEFGRFGGKLNA